MSITVTFSERPAQKQSLEILKKLSQGKFKVYHARCASQGIEYAIKAFPKDAFGTAQYMKETVMFGLCHQNVIKSYPISKMNSSNSSDDYRAIITEFALYDIFDLVVGGLFDSEILIRSYFHQFIQGLEYVHSKGIAHLDLKLENLMMGVNFTLKIIDFDQAQRLTERKVTSGGTVGFRAPEVIDGSCKNFAAADIYSAGVILYAFKAKSIPFPEKTSRNAENKKTTTLEYYSSFTRENKVFWETKTINLRQNKDFFSNEFRDLINGMLEADVAKRFTLNDIKSSAWYQGPVLDAESLKSQMQAKCDSFKRQ